MRAVAWPDGARNAVIVDVPIGDALRREVHDEMGISIGDSTSVLVPGEDNPGDRGRTSIRVDPRDHQR